MTAKDIWNSNDYGDGIDARDFPRVICLGENKQERVAASTSNYHLTFRTRLWNNREDADLTVICGDKTFKVHRQVVYPRAKYCDRLCNGRFMVKPL